MYTVLTSTLASGGWSREGEGRGLLPFTRSSHSLQGTCEFQLNLALQIVMKAYLPGLEDKMSFI